MGKGSEPFGLLIFLWTRVSQKQKSSRKRNRDWYKQKINYYTIRPLFIKIKNKQKFSFHNFSLYIPRFL